MQQIDTLYFKANCLLKITQAANRRYIIKKNSAHGFDEGLLDIHEKAALQQVLIVPGETLKAAVCSWCGYPTQNQHSTGAHIRKDHEGILIV